MIEILASEENLSRVHTIPLGRAWLTPQYRRTDRVVNIIREFAKKHMKSENVKLDQDLNRQIWSRGRTNPPRRVRVRMVKDEDGIVTVSLYEELGPESPSSGEEKILQTEEASATTGELDNESIAEEKKSQAAG